MGEMHPLIIMLVASIGITGIGCFISILGILMPHDLRYFHLSRRLEAVGSWIAAPGVIIFVVVILTIMGIGAATL